MRRFWRLPLVVAVLAVALPSRCTAAVPVPTVTVSFELVAQVPNGPALTGSLTLTPATAGSVPVVVPIQGKGPVTVEVPAGTRWQVSLDVPGYWAPPLALVVEPGSAAIDRKLDIWPLGTIAGRVYMADPAERLPPGIAVATGRPDRGTGERAFPKNRLVCPLDAQGVWRCNLPAATFDLALSAEGFIPHYRWGVEVPVGRALVLGTLELKRGASVAGWVEVEGGSLAGPACRARLLPLVAPGSGRRTVDRILETAGEVEVRKDGFFQLAGIAPGSYVLEVGQPEFAPARASPIEVWPGAQTLVQQPLVLKRPLQLEIAISPPVDWLGHPWRLEVLRASDFSANFDRDPAFAGPAGDSGHVVIPGQAPGVFALEVSDSLGNRFFGDQHLRIDGPEDAQRTIEIDLVTVQGSLTLGREPLAGDLWFGGRYGARSVKMEADRDGKFHGVLPKGGSWDVEIEAADPKLKTERRVRVTADRAGRAKVDLAVPSTHVFGRVLGEDDRPVPGAVVSLTTQEVDVELETDDNGTFETRGVDAGTAYLTASAQGGEESWTGDQVQVSVAEGRAVGPLELRLRRAKSLAGKVVSPLGPVVGAMVLALPQRPDELFPDGARTDLEGSFKVRVPAKTEAAALVVSPPGHALQAFAVQLDAPPPVLNVAAEGGVLEVSLPSSQEEIGDAGLLVSVFQNELPLPLFALVQWARGHGQDFAPEDLSKFRVPALAPGSYRVCLLPRLAQREAEPTESACAAGSLVDGGVLTLTIPARRQPRKGKE